MKFHQLFSELGTVRMNGRQPPFSTPELRSYFAPLYTGLCKTKPAAWQGVFMIGVNALIKYVNHGDSIRLICDSPAMARMALEYGHRCDWHARPSALRTDVERGSVSQGVIGIDVHEADEGAAMRPAGVGFLFSTQFAEAETVIAQSIGRRLFLFMRIGDHERDAFLRLVDRLGPQTCINTWLDFTDGGEHCVIASVTHGLDQHEI